MQRNIPARPSNGGPNNMDIDDDSTDDSSSDSSTSSSSSSSSTSTSSSSSMSSTTSGSSSDTDMPQVVVARKEVKWVEALSENIYTITVEVTKENFGDRCNVQGTVRFEPGYQQPVVGVDTIDRLIHKFCSKPEDEVAFLQAELMGPLFNASGIRIPPLWSDDPSTELSDLLFGEGEDIYYRLRHPKLKQLNEKKLQEGGLLHIQEVETHPDHSGRDLGIQMIHMAMDLLSRRPKNANDYKPWMIVAAVPGPLGFEARFAELEQGRVCKKYWYPKEKPTRQNIGYKQGGESSGINYKTAFDKVALQFERIGFAQAARSPDEFCSVWFITRDMFVSAQKPFGYPVQLDSNNRDRIRFRSSCLDPANTKWKTKSEAAETMDIYQIPTARTVSESDKHLHRLLLSQNKKLVDELYVLQENQRLAQEKMLECRLATEQLPSLDQALTASSMARAHANEVRRRLSEASKLNDQIERRRAVFKEQFKEESWNKIRYWLERGASFDGSQAFHACIHECGDTAHHLALIEVLVAKGANLNFQDEHGRSPLHFAASRMQQAIINYLLLVGADPTIKSLSYHTPFDEVMEEMTRAIELHSISSCSRVMSAVDSALDLMPSEQRKVLNDGFLPPRMMHRLACIAEMEARRLENLVNCDPENAVANAENEMVAWNQVERYRLCYVPACRVDFEYYPQYEYWTTFVAAYQTFWRSAATLLRSGRAPTVTNIHEFIESRCPAYMGLEGEGFSGIRVEYMLDALFDIGKNTWEDNHDKDEALQKLPRNPFDDHYMLVWSITMIRGGTLHGQEYPRPLQVEWLYKLSGLCENTVNSYS